MTLAWHFVGDTLRDGRPVPADGEVLAHDGQVTICNAGLHASRDPWDALGYAPGDTLCLVWCEDIEAEHDDKFVCRRRTILARMDYERRIWEFARACALDVIDLWDAPDVVVQYLKTGDEGLRDAARDAAWAAAWAAARDAARAAARDAGDAARAARAAARDAQKKRFNKMVHADFADALREHAQ